LHPTRHLVDERAEALRKGYALHRGQDRHLVRYTQVIRLCFDLRIARRASRDSDDLGQQVGCQLQHHGTGGSQAPKHGRHVREFGEHLDHVPTGKPVHRQFDAADFNRLGQRAEIEQ
jgi:hypothetical protein